MNQLPLRLSGNLTSKEEKGKLTHIADYQLQELFEGLCEQSLDYLGIEKGRKFLYDKFPQFIEEVNLKIDAYRDGKRITRKLNKPDPDIVKICKGYE